MKVYDVPNEGVGEVRLHARHAVQVRDCQCGGGLRGFDRGCPGAGSVKSGSFFG